MTVLRLITTLQRSEDRLNKQRLMWIDCMKVELNDVVQQLRHFFTAPWLFVRALWRFGFCARKWWKFRNCKGLYELSDGVRRRPKNRG